MTAPQDPFASPSDQGGPGYGNQPPPYGSQPAYGAPPPGYGPPGQQKSGTSGLAIAALVCSFLIPLVGLILGFVARSQIRKTGQGGNGLATAAIIISVVSMVITALALSGGLLAA